MFAVSALTISVSSTLASLRRPSENPRTGVGYRPLYHHCRYNSACSERDRADKFILSLIHHCWLLRRVLTGFPMASANNQG
jgi:hypothetical protein